MNINDYQDSIKLIDNIIKKTREESKILIQSLELLKRLYKWEEQDYIKKLNKSSRNRDIWKKNKIIRKDECFECGLTNNIHYHHVVPDELGGKRTLPLCINCHGKIHNRKFVDISSLVKVAIKKRKELGNNWGRPKGTTEKTEDILKKEEYQYAISLLIEKKYSIRQISQMAKISVNTTLKLKRCLDTTNFNKPI